MEPTSKYHLETKPATGGAPIMESEAMAKAPKVKGMVLPNPFSDHAWPQAMQYQFGNFKYFFILLAAGG